MGFVWSAISYGITLAILGIAWLAIRDENGMERQMRVIAQFHEGHLPPMASDAAIYSRSDTFTAATEVFKGLRMGESDGETGQGIMYWTGLAKDKRNDAYVSVTGLYWSGNHIPNGTFQGYTPEGQTIGVKSKAGVSFSSSSGTDPLQGVWRAAPEEMEESEDAVTEAMQQIF